MKWYDMRQYNLTCYDEIRYSEITLRRYIYFYLLFQNIKILFTRRRYIFIDEFLMILALFYYLC